MELDAFLDTLKKLAFVDKQDWMGDAFWRRFHDNPVRAFIAAREDERERIWLLIKPER